MEEILAGVWCMLLVFGCLASLLWKRRQTSRSEREHQDEPQPQQDCINRIITLESMGRLSGVMDDRGKYIYISPEEMKAVADTIKHQGRVSISHLASKYNQFISLGPKPQLNELNTDCIAVE